MTYRPYGIIFANNFNFILDTINRGEYNFFMWYERRGDIRYPRQYTRIKSRRELLVTLRQPGRGIKRKVQKKKPVPFVFIVSSHLGVRRQKKIRRIEQIFNFHIITSYNPDFNSVLFSICLSQRVALISIVVSGYVSY